MLGKSKRIKNSNSRIGNESSRGALLCGISCFDFRSNITSLVIFLVILLQKWSREPFCLFLVIYESAFWIDRILLEVNGADFVKSDFVIPVWRVIRFCRIWRVSGPGFVVILLFYCGWSGPPTIEYHGGGSFRVKITTKFLLRKIAIRSNITTKIETWNTVLVPSIRNLFL
jgi:hypothetical protein